MTGEEIARLLSQGVKLVRTEYGLSQEKMAGLLGLSKKTLIQVEKGRSRLNWSAVVTLCALFSQSEVLYSALGDEPMAVVKAVAITGDRHRSLGKKIWRQGEEKCLRQ